MLDIVLNLFLMYVVIVASIWFINGLMYWIIIYWKLAIRLKKWFNYYYWKKWTIKDKKQFTVKTTL